MHYMEYKYENYSTLPFWSGQDKNVELQWLSNWRDYVSYSFDCFFKVRHQEGFWTVQKWVVLIWSTIVWKKSPLEIFMWNLFVVKYFRPLQSPMNKNITFLIIVKNISFVQFMLCHTSDKKFLASNFSQTTV